MFDPQQIKADFPLFDRPENRDLVYLDNAATAQKPRVVLEAFQAYYQRDNANVHRGVHRLSDASTTAWMEARETIAAFFGAKPAELVITRNTTEAINGAAYGWGDAQIKKGDVIISSQIEHHANLVPWQELCRRTGATLKLIPVLDDGSLDNQWFENHLDKQVKLVAIQHVSNALGTVHAIEKIITMARAVGARTLIDAAQSAPHLPLNFARLKADFLAFSGHKMFGPMGIGGLLVRQELLDSNEMKPWLFGGGMIASVTEQSAEYHPDSAERFTAGTPDVASTVGLAAACDYLKKLGFDDVVKHDQALVATTLDRLATVKKIELLGSTDRVGSVSFLYVGVHPHDVAQILDSENIAVRSGHHCCMPLHTHFGWPGSVRASFAPYNSIADIDRLMTALEKVQTVFG